MSHKASILPYAFLLAVFSWMTVYGFSQINTGNEDTFFLAKRKGILGKIGRSISTKGEIPTSGENGIKRNEESFRPFAGKIIRRIIVQKMNFNKTIEDTSRSVQNLFNDLGNKLHPNTSEKVIKRNLFFKERDTLYPALVADNERFLRDISYLQDAKILVRNADQHPGEVDVILICKDLFPVGGSADLGSERMLNYELNDDNLAGTGDRIAVKNMVDLDRLPHYGIGFDYIKRNIRGSFVNINLGYSNMEPAFNSGRKEETALYFKADLPLISPYSVFTGGFETSLRYTKNNFISDSLYHADYRYEYRIMDGWIGYNVGAKKQLSLNIKNRLKHILALRSMHRVFFEIPNTFKTKYNSAYTNLNTVLASVSVFEQDYYHTNFIYGFGRNEDIPEGFSMSLTSGWTDRNNVNRPYLGFDYQRSYFTKRKSYLNYILKLGTYFSGKGPEDFCLLSGIELFTRLRKIDHSKWLTRQFFKASITQELRTVMNDPLFLSSIYGVPELSAPDIEASTRITANYESVFYNTWKFFGFNFAPFGFTNISYLKEQHKSISSGDIYSALGIGVRTRNENLVFGTMELKAFYFPRTQNNMSPWNVSFNTALQYKYSSQLVKKPDFVNPN